METTSAVMYMNPQLRAARIKVQISANAASKYQ